MMKVAPTIQERTQVIQRQAYLRSKGINPALPVQLDLAFPGIQQLHNLRHLPNDYARSSLFSVRNKCKERQFLEQVILFHYNQHVSIKYTGIELRAGDDEIVWLQIIHYGKSVVLGEPFDFSLRDLVKDVGWSANGRNYDRARKCISRLKATELLASNSKAYGTSGAISLIQNYVAVNDAGGNATHYQVWLDPNLIVMLAGNTFTSHSWKRYRTLTPVARRLADYIESHKNPYPLALGKFKQMCGSSDASITSWRQTVRKACKEVQDAKIASYVDLLKGDLISCLA